MISIIKNNFYRALGMKTYIVTTLLIMSLTILFSVYFTANMQGKLNIAVVGNMPPISVNSKNVNITNLKKEPLRSELLMNKYDAVIKVQKVGYSVYIIKGDSFKKEILNILDGKKAEGSSNIRSVGDNIIGFLLMFILISSLFFSKIFAEDKEEKVLTRIMTTPISMVSYLVGSCIFNFLIVYVTTLVILFLDNALFKINVGFSYEKYSYLIAILCLLGTAFTMFMNCIVEKYDNCSVLSSGIIVITSMLSGSFYSLKNNNIFLKLLPQKQFMNFLLSLEDGTKAVNYNAVLYIVAVSALFILGGSLILRKKYV